MKKIFNKTVAMMVIVALAITALSGIAFKTIVGADSDIAIGTNVVPSNLKWSSFSVRDDLNTDPPGEKTEWGKALDQEIARAKQAAEADFHAGKITEEEYYYKLADIDNWQSYTQGSISSPNTSKDVTLKCVNTGWDGEYLPTTYGGEKVLVGDNPWGLTLSMDKIPVEFGREYTLEFDISSDLEREDNNTYKKVRSDKYCLVKAYDYQSFGEPSAAFESFKVNGEEIGNEGKFKIAKTPKDSELVKTHIVATFRIPGSKNEWSSGKDRGSTTSMGIRFSLGAFLKTHINDCNMGLVDYGEEIGLTGNVYVNNLKVIAGEQGETQPYVETTTNDSDVQYWHPYFGANDGSFWEGAEGSLVNVSSNQFTACMTRVGWGGVYGCQIKRDVNIIKNQKYTVSFKIKSSQANKYIYLFVGDALKPAFNKWIELPAGKEVTVNETFIAKENANQVCFALGGECGDREGSDDDASIRYAAFDQQFGDNKHIQLATLDCDGDFSVSTDISVSFTNFFNDNIEPTTDKPVVTNPSINNGGTSKTSIGKVQNVKVKNKKKRKAVITWSKLSGAKQYQVKYALNKKLKKAKTKNVSSNKLTVKKLKKKKTYFFTVRGFVDSTYGQWSDVKKVKIKK